ncbi:PAS domain-containing hybrid sensor histidine kinase/response regulator [Clostridioides sp. ES-W-0016-02]|uniref:PAS domain-containing hybrid sensor histidine kinase/response regulator n=1 Tax=Clostridioides sp. ES-W-0016-02 TaxID=2770788 RepID=UPI001D12D1A2|nr:response regulator [Clostridioides sp. ES-W-0016-02]
MNIEEEKNNLIDDSQYQLELYRSSSLGGVYTVKMDDKFTLLYGNDLYFQLHGYQKEKLLNKSCTIFIHPEDLKNVQEALFKAKKANSKTAEWEMRILTGDGKIKHTLVSGRFNIRNYEKVFDGYITDITKQKQMEEKILQLTEIETDLRKQIELYRTTDLGGVFTVVVDENFTLLYGNDKYYKIHEYTKESMLERIHNHCSEYVHPYDLPIVHEIIHTALNSGKDYVEWDMRVITGNGNIRYILCSGVFDNKDGVTLMNGVVMDITKQKRIEQALRESEEKFRIATENSDVAFWSYNFEKKEIFQTQSSKFMHGYDNIVKNVPESLVEEGYIRSDSIKEYLEMYYKMRNGAKTVSGEFWMKNLDTNGWWCEHIDYTTVFDETGKPVYAHAIGKDVTTKKLAESRYNEEISYKNALISEDIVASMRVDLTSGLVEEVDSPYEEIIENYFGKNYSECVAILSDLLINDEQKNDFLSSMQTDILVEDFKNGETKKNFHVQRKMPDNTYRWVSTTIKLFQKPNSDHIVGFLYSYDINNEILFHQIMDLISHTNYDFVGYINAINASYILFADNGKKVLSKNTKKSYESTISEYFSKYLDRKQHDEIINKLLLSVVTKELETKNVYTIEYTIKVENGVEKRKQLKFAYIDKQAQTLFYTQSDITEIINNEKKHQEILHDALVAAKQANKAKTEFLSHMSHEIRTPMNAIIGMSTLAAQVVNDTEQVSDCLSKIGISARFLLSLINDILDMSRIESGKLSVKQEKIPFEEFINGINAISYTQAQDKGVDYDAIVTSFTENYYIGDAMKLQQVLVNIISNAIKFTPKGGKVQFIISQEKQTKDFANMKFIINDTGVGISEDFINHIFEPFTQQHMGSTAMYGGTGLGLAICKHLVELMGGEISVNSIEGVGSEFVIELKLGVSEESHKKSIKKSQVHFNKMKALIVDDDIIICRHTEQILEDMGLKADYVDSGMSAIKRVQELWNKDVYYDIILVDWKMPNMDGIETTRALRKIVGQNVTIIIMTAYDWLSIEKEAKSAGVNMLISKPLFRDSISSAFEKIYMKKDEEIVPPNECVYDFTGKRVLLVEDHMLNIEVAKRLLNSKNLEVDVAENGLLGIEAFASAPAGYYDAILMDIRMPVMDGLLAAKSIRQMRKKNAATIPIIAMTANAFDEDIEKTKEAGMNAHIAKPVEPKKLFSTINNFFSCENK